MKNNTDKNLKVDDDSKLTDDQIQDIIDLEALDGVDAIDPSTGFVDDQEGIEDLERDILKEEEIERNESGQNTSKKMLHNNK